MTAVIGRLAGEKHVSRLLHKRAFGSYNQRFAPARTPMDWLTKEKQKVDAYMADPLCGFIFTVNGFRTLFELIHRIQKPENLEKMPEKLPVLVVSGSDDPVGDYGVGVRRAVESMEKAGMEQLTCKMYSGDRHEILNETDRMTVMADLDCWMEENVLETFF